MMCSWDQVLTRRSQLILSYRLERRRRLRQISELARAGEPIAPTTTLHLRGGDEPPIRAPWWGSLGKRFRRLVA